MTTWFEQQLHWYNLEKNNYNDVYLLVFAEDKVHLINRDYTKIGEVTLEIGAKLVEEAINFVVDRDDNYWLVTYDICGRAVWFLEK